MRPPVEILDHVELPKPAGGERGDCHGDLILAIVSEYNRRKGAEARGGLVADGRGDDGAGAGGSSIPGNDGSGAGDSSIPVNDGSGAGDSGITGKQDDVNGNVSSR